MCKRFRLVLRLVPCELGEFVIFWCKKWVYNSCPNFQFMQCCKNHSSISPFCHYLQVSDLSSTNQECLNQNIFFLVWRENQSNGHSLGFIIESLNTWCTHVQLPVNCKLWKRKGDAPLHCRNAQPVAKLQECIVKKNKKQYKVSTFCTEQQ